MKRSTMKLDEYTKRLWSQRKTEVIKESAENQVSQQTGKGLTSPVSDLPTEELKLVSQYMHRKNLINISNALPEHKKQLVLRKFFRHKRNQQVEVYLKIDDHVTHFVGKVNTNGRDFVILTTLKERIWLPFQYIESAKVPFGLPEISSAHQHFVYDEELRTKLITRFSETVAAKDVLVQQFFEETLETNLRTWKNTRVQVVTKTGEILGKMIASQNGALLLKGFKDQHSISLSDVVFIKHIRLLDFLSWTIKKKGLNIFRE